MAMDNEFFEKLYDKQERIADDVSDIKVTLAAQHESLKLHMRRSDALEAQVEIIKKDANMLHGALKLIGLIGVISGIATSVLKILKFI